MRRFPLVAAALLASVSTGYAQPFLGPAAAPTNDVAARVNGEPIKLVDVQAVLDQRPAPVKLTAEQERAHRRAALDMLIDDALMRQYLSRTVQTPPVQEVERVVSEFAEALRKQNRTLDQYLREEKQTELELADIGHAQVFVICNKVDEWLTGNLLGPIVVNAANRTAQQVVLTEKKWTTRQPLFKLQAEVPLAKSA